MAADAMTHSQPLGRDRIETAGDPVAVGIDYLSMHMTVQRKAIQRWSSQDAAYFVRRAVVCILDLPDADPLEANRFRILGIERCLAGPNQIRPVSHAPRGEQDQG